MSATPQRLYGMHPQVVQSRTEPLRLAYLTVPSQAPVIDDCVRRLAGLFTTLRTHRIRAPQVCVCGATMPSLYHLGQDTDVYFGPLVLHVLAWHRADVTEGQLNIVRAAGDTLADPDPDMLGHPEPDA